MPENSTKLQTCQHSESPVSLAVLSPRSVFLTVHSPHLMLYWKLGKTSPIARLDGHNSSVSAVTIGEDERVLASGSEAGTVMLWDMNVQRAVASLKGSRSAVTSLDLGTGKQAGLLAVASADGIVRLWDSRAKDAAAELICTQTGAATAVKISPNSDLLASGGAQGGVSLWDLAAQRPVHEFDFHEVSPHLLAFHPSQQALVCAGLSRQLTVWDLQSYAPAFSTAFRGLVQSISFHPSAQCLFIATGTEIQALEVEPWKAVGCIEGGLNDILDISSAAATLTSITACDSGLEVWSTDLSSIMTTAAPTSPPAPVSAVSIPSSQVQSQALLEVAGNHTVYMDLLKKKKENLSTVAQWWSEANINATIGSLAMLKDVPVCADVFQAWIVESSAENMQLDHLPLVLPLCLKLIESKYDAFGKVGLAATHTLLVKFSPLISNSLLDGAQREDLSRKCEAAINHFAQVMNSPAIVALVSRSSKLSPKARKLVEELEVLIWSFRRRPIAATS